MPPFTPASTESLLLSLRQPIAFVGNGHPGRPLGEVIDRYATVVRFNDYRLEGFRSLIGSRTTVRAVNGWTDIEPREGVIAISPFTAAAAESAHFAAFRARSTVPVLQAITDVRELLPDVPKPSTGLALAALASHLGLEVDLFGFDGFATGHYWNATTELHTTHSKAEPERLLRLPGITLYGRSFDYASLYDYCHAEHADYGVNEGLTLCTALELTFPGERVIEFGAGNGDLSRYLEQTGSRVTALEVSPTALARIPVTDKRLGDALTLTTIGESFDRFVSFDVLEHLTENDVRIVVREAARIAERITVTVCTRPSGLTGPQGENLHLTVRPVGWWHTMFGRYFDIRVATGHGIGQLVITGTRRDNVDASDDRRAAPAVAPPDARLALPTDYVSRAVPSYFHDTVEVTDGITWQPDVYTTAAEMARALGCGTIVDIGCGQARKLAAMHPEFRVIGVDFGANIAHCRATYPFGSWLEADFERHDMLPIPTAVLRDAVVVCADVIEHLIDPRPLLATLRDLLRDARAVILTSPDRERTHGSVHRGPPPNPAHTREWTADELGRLCAQEGLTLLSVGHTRSNDVSPDLATAMVVLAGHAVDTTATDANEQNASAAAQRAVGIPSVQLGDDGKPRFLVPLTPDDASFAAYWTSEAEGGVAAEVRVYLDAQIAAGDVLLDLDPGPGFVALSALTAPNGAPSVMLAGLGAEQIRALRKAAASHESQVSRLDADAGRWAQAAAEQLAPHGRVFVHATAAQVPNALAALAPLVAADRVMAICINDAADTANWDAAAASLEALGFVGCAIAERMDEVIIFPVYDAPSAAVIALPARVLQGSGVA